MLVEFIGALKKYDSVLAVGGHGHVMELEELIKKEIAEKFGDCSVTKIKTFLN